MKSCYVEYKAKECQLKPSRNGNYSSTSVTERSSKILRGDLQRVLMEAKVAGKRRQGRPKTSLTDKSRSWTGLSCSEALVIAHDREGWRIILSNPSFQFPFFRQNFLPQRLLFPANVLPSIMVPIQLNLSFVYTTFGVISISLLLLL